MAQLIAGIELGGTKAVAVLARGTAIIDRVRVPTTTPDETLGALEGWLAAAARYGDLAALGIASFGPLGVDPGRPGHGMILGTPKPGWAGTDLLGRLRARFGVPTGIDTDVNGAALAEARWGAGQDAGVLVYLTIGTGVGGGIVIDRRAIHGALHPEIGHLRLRRRAGDGFAGICPWHGDCVEGLVSGPALAARTGVAGEAIPHDHPVWDAYVDDVAELLAAIIVSVSPHRILIGGGVGLGQAHRLPAIRNATAARLANYLGPLADDLIASPGLGEDAGPMGALVIAHDALAL